ncbi:MAG: 4Fe-4S binding protein [Acidobacteria bacterium]|jgi:NAD-dependent dihydropyrimidine dehydrogenase PreA subunit|nr:4Fe-4S binding protein [Acidobacteriota bacterium]
MIEVVIDYEICENNQFCREVCPDDVFELRLGKIIVARPEACTECWLCVQNCPTGAVTIEA